MKRQDRQDRIWQTEREPRDVILVASGYEWTCPDCDTANEEIQVLDRIVCQGCKRTFLGIAEHAFE